MGHITRLSELFLAERIGPVTLDMNLTQVAEVFPPPDVWNLCADEVFPSLWNYRGGELAFESRAPHPVFYVKIYTEYFDGGVSLFASDAAVSDRSLVLLDQEGLDGEARPSDLIAFLTKAGEAAGKNVEILFLTRGNGLQFHVGYGGMVDATFTLDSDNFDPMDGTLGAKGEDAADYAEIASRANPYALDLDNPSWLRLVDEYADLYAIYIRGGALEEDADSHNSKKLSGVEYLDRAIR